MPHWACPGGCLRRYSASRIRRRVDFSRSSFALASARALAAASLAARFASIAACSASRACCSKKRKVWLMVKGWPRLPGASGAGLVLVREHQSDGGSGVVYVERASGGNQLREAGRAVVGVAHVERYRQPAGAGLGADDREAKHPHDIPKPAGFVLPGDTGRDGYALLIDSARDEHGEADSRFLRRFRHVDLETVRNRLRAGVLINDIP